MSDSPTPTFSVVLPTYDRADRLHRSIGSVLAQRWTDFELLVVDDGSTDDTPALLAGIDDERLRPLWQENRGVSAARNLGLHNARGRWVTFLDSDDEASPDWLARFAEAADSPQVGLISAGARVIDAEGGGEEIWLPRRHGPILGDRPLRYAPPGTLAARRSLLLAVGGYTEGLAFAENSELVLRLLPACLEQGLEVAAIDRPLIVYHRDASAWRSGDAAFRKMRHAAELILDRHGERLRALYPGGYANYRGVAAVNAARLGDVAAARRHLRAALRVEPGRLATWGRLALTLAPPLARWFWRRHGAAARHGKTP